MAEQFLPSQVWMIHRSKFGGRKYHFSVSVFTHILIGIVLFTFFLRISAFPNLVIDPENVHNVDPDVDGVDEVGEWEVELVVGAGQAEVLAGGEGLGAGNLLPGAARPPSVTETQALRQHSDKYEYRKF